MTTQEKKAVEAFNSGLNCAQAVLMAYSDDLKIDTGLALSMACGFGGGMGRLQETCGAVTGSYMVMGVYNCRKYADNKERKNKTYAMVQEFSKRFKSIYGTTDCIELLKCDLNTGEGQKFLKDNNLHALVCEKCIADSIKIITEIMQ